VPHICVQGLELHGGCLVIVAIRHSMNHSHERCIWQLSEVTSHSLASTLSLIRRRSFVASPSLLPNLPNLVCTFPHTHLSQLSLNSISIIKNFQWQPGLQSLRNICNSRLPVQGSISQLFLMVLSPDRWPTLLLQKPSYPYFHPLVDGTNIEMPHPLANCFKENSVCFKLIEALPSAPPKSDKWSLS